MSPFDVTILILNPKKAPAVSKAAETLFAELETMAIDVLLDDRDARPGVKFADADLIGIPHRVVIGERGLNDGIVEYRYRKTGDESKLAIDAVSNFLRERISRS